MESKLLDRKASFKKIVSADDGRRRRGETTLQIRKSKKEEQLAKRRAGAKSTTTTATSSNATVTPIPDLHNAADLSNIVETMRNPTCPPALVEAARKMRKILAVERNAPNHAVVCSGALPLLVAILSMGDCPEAQFEAAWALTNIASSAYTAEVVNAGAVPPLVMCLRSSEANVREQAAWCIGNIAGDSVSMRDLVMEQGALEPLLMNLRDPANDSLLGNVVWAVSNLMRGKPQPELHKVTPALPYLVQLLLNPPNKNVLTDVCWSLSYISDGRNDRIQSVVDHNVAPRLVELLDSDSNVILTPVIRCLGNFVSGNEAQTQAVLDANFLKCTKKLLSNRRKNIRKETCWVLSNIAAGTESQIDLLFMKDACLSIVVEFSQSSQWEIRKEALWVVANIFSGGNDSHIGMLAGIGGIEAMCKALTVSDSSILLTCLDALEKILEVGLRNGKNYDIIVDECEGVEAMENLQQHANDDVYKKVLLIIDTYYGSEEVEDENLAPAVNGDTFAFGIPSKQLFADNKPSAPSSQEGASQQPFQEQFNFGGPIYPV